MESKRVDWGPKPFRFINAWCTHPDFKKIVEDSWNSYDVEGWYWFRVKEKLKRLKDDLMKWNRDIFGSIDNKVEQLKQDIHELDMIDDTFGLEEEEVMCRKEKNNKFV